MVPVLTCLFAGTMFSIPAILRYGMPHQVQREKLTGSQRQRGMYMNAGSQDVGVDPDWDIKNARWTGHDHKEYKDEDQSYSKVIAKEKE